MFTGFSPDTLHFLRDLRENNNKKWFDEHRAIYESTLIDPFKSLVETLTPSMTQIDEWFDTKPTAGKALCRINRDIRYSHDKTIYRNRYWLRFRRARREWPNAPQFFFEISPEWYRYGLGYYKTPKETLAILRQEIINEPQQFLDAISCCKKPFVQYGESYKRPLKKDLPPELVDWYNRKTIAVVVQNEQLEDLFDPKLAKTLVRRFKQLEPLYHYLMRIEFIKNIPSM